MIVKNEAEILKLALDSTQGLADEVVILDTGSTDNTVELARAWGAWVYEGGDAMHKGQSRNQAIEHATGDWVVILDADEQIADPVGLRAFLEQTDADAVYIRLAFMDGDKQTLTYPQMRIWRKGKYWYKYRAHEVPLPADGWGKLAHTEFVWEHRPPAGRGWKSDYTLNRLLLDVQENPDDARPKYYLGRQYMYRSEWDEAIKFLTAYLETTGNYNTADAYHCLAECYRGKGDKGAEIGALYQAAAVLPERREWWGELAAIYHEQGKDIIAVALLKAMLEIPVPPRGYVRQVWYGPHAHDLLARCLWKLGRYEEGREHAQIAVDMAPDDERLRRNLQWFVDKLNPSDDAVYRKHGPEIHAGRPRFQVIADLCKGPRVMDFGCGPGDLLLLLQAEHPDWHLLGVDTSDVARDMAKERGVKAHLAWGITSGQFDTVVCSQVLEHVDDDVGLVQKLAQHVKPGGRLIVTVPREDRIPAPNHKREYTEDGLRELLQGLGPVEIRPELAKYRILAVVDTAPRHILITGCAKSGTTLLQRLMHAFDVDVVDGEQTLQQLASMNGSRVLVGKRHRYTLFSEHLSDTMEQAQAEFIQNRGIQVINLIRNGEDVIASSEGWVSPRRWASAMHQRNRHRGLISHELRYEDIIQQPDYQQQRLADKLGLTVLHKWSEYPAFVPDEAFALGGQEYARRPLDDSSIGKGRDVLIALREIETAFTDAMYEAGYQ